MGPPKAEMAATAVAGIMGPPSIKVRRLLTGTCHYVFEVFLQTGASVVVRMGCPDQREEMAHGLRLARRLQALGVPLPQVLAEGLDQPCPWVILERLSGTDLEYVIGSLPEERLRSIAATVAEAQLAASRFGSAGRYGYAPTAETAPDATWSAVLDASISRSRRRIIAAGLFEPSVVEVVAGRIDTHRTQLDAVPAVPFLHDTTTKNVIVTPAGLVSGIVDTDDLCFGDPRYAPALTLAALLAYGGPVSYVGAWMAAAGHHDDRIFRLYVALSLVGLMSDHGQRFNGNEFLSTPETRENLVHAFHKIEFP